MSNVVKFVGMPDGAKEFIAELGEEVGTFTQPPNSKVPCLNHHVPLKMRGDFQPEQLANFDAAFDYRTDPFGKMLCYAVTAKDIHCAKRAVNRSWRCNLHGGRVHPLDKLEKDPQETANAAELEAMSRYQQYLAGYITVEDLDDEELAQCGFRSKVNGSIFKPRNVPRELAEAFTKAIYEKAQNNLKAGSTDAANTLVSIMKNTKVEPDIRLKAASIILDRTLGKPSQKLDVGIEMPGFQQIMTDIFSGTREESRKARGFDVDGEVVGERRIDSTPDAIGGGISDIAERSTVTGDSGIGSGSDGSSFEAIVNDAQQDPRSRLSERNEAILSRAIEVKPFEYDLTDHSEEVKLATKKRYAQAADDVWYEIHRDKTGFVTMTLPTPPKRPKAADTKRKGYTLDDF